MLIIMDENVAHDLAGLEVERVASKIDDGTGDEIATYATGSGGPRFTRVHQKPDELTPDQRQLSVASAIRRAMGGNIKYDLDREQFVLKTSGTTVTWKRELARFGFGRPPKKPTPKNESKKIPKKVVRKAD